MNSLVSAELQQKTYLMDVLLLLNPESGCDTTGLQSKMSRANRELIPLKLMTKGLYSVRGKVSDPGFCCAS